MPEEALPPHPGAAVGSWTQSRSDSDHNEELQGHHCVPEISFQISRPAGSLPSGQLQM